MFLCKLDLEEMLILGILEKNSDKDTETSFSSKAHTMKLQKEMWE